MIPQVSAERTRVLVLTHSGGSEMGWATGWYADGTAYCVLDSGSQGNFPVGSVRVVEDKVKPRAGFETK